MPVPVPVPVPPSLGWCWPGSSTRRRRGFSPTPARGSLLVSSSSGGWWRWWWSADPRIRTWIAFRLCPLLLASRRGFESCVCVCVHPWFGYFSGTQDRSRRTCLGSTELPCPAPGPPLMRHSDLGWLSSAAIAELLQ